MEKKYRKKKPKSCKDKKRKNTAFFFSKCALCDSKKSKFIKWQEASGLLSGLGIKACLSKIPLVALLLFQRF